MKRFYCENLNNGFVQLPPQEARHAISVMRLSKGESVELLDGAGGVAQAIIEDVKKGAVSLKIENFKQAEPPTGAKIIIASSIAKGDRFDWLISKCTELGVDRITPIIFERTVKLAQNDKSQERWKNIAISAMKQCGRLFLPIIDSPVVLPLFLENIKKDYPNGQLLVGWPGEQAQSVDNISSVSLDTVVLIGPEGGFSSAEEELLADDNTCKVNICENILRIETAAVAFAAILKTKIEKK